MNKLPQALRRLREGAKLSQRTLAKRADVSPAFLCKLEAGAYGSLSISKGRALADGLGMTFRDFLNSVGMLEDEDMPNANAKADPNAALAGALRKRKLNDGQIDSVIVYVEMLERA